MNKSLDEAISDRQSANNRGRRSRRRNDWPRDGVRKVSLQSRFDFEHNHNENRSGRRDHSDWVHDKFDDDQSSKAPRASHFRPRNRPSPETESNVTGAKIRIDNLHYELGKDDLEDLFSRKGPVLKVDIRYDRAGRSDGVAFVTYESIDDATAAIHDYDGANANGQPIRLTLMSNSVSTARPRNPFDTAQKPSRSLFDRITEPPPRSRSRSPDRSSSIRHSDVSKPPPGHIDRYIPGQRTRSPLPARRGGSSTGGRRPGARREERERGSGRMGKDGRPRKTQEELDAEMEDYFGGNGEEGGHTVTGTGNGASTTTVDDDVEMIE
ncbi:hypothetical protein GP486_004534 [Trichoglossum hirsutum]|uniref:RRM domain-containing protein n=1 Tax=Trichoglossum hirsutum TaxID=265104 RepID=A0A9P8LAW4_9PEZI|nr:hypothetical protein GP486_004534 [Trichoglossum hirsutum]